MFKCPVGNGKINKNPALSIDRFIQREGLCVPPPTCHVAVHTTGREFLGFSVTVICDFTLRDQEGEALFHSLASPHPLL